MVKIRYLALISGMFLIALFPACKCSVTTAKLSDLATYKDNAYSVKTSSFGAQDTVYVKTGTELNISKGEIEWRLLAKQVAGQQANTPVPQGDATVKIDGNQPVNYSISAPSNGWPAGTYSLEATLKFDGEAKDKKSVEFTVVAAPVPVEDAGEEDDFADDEGGENGE